MVRGTHLLDFNKQPKDYHENPLKILSTLLLSLPIINGCDVLRSQLQPRTMTIEYDEEVKLHDGSMIWVHITRHYGLVGGGMEYKSSYMPTEVEISWDTGFEGVGRRSVYFDEYIFSLNKYNDKWYILGVMSNSSKKIEGSESCKEIGVKLGDSGCLVVIDQNGITHNQDKLTIHYNILDPVHIKNWGDVPFPLKNQSINWNDKLQLQSQQNEDFRRIGKSYSIQ